MKASNHLHNFFYRFPLRHFYLLSQVPCTWKQPLRYQRCYKNVQIRIYELPFFKAIGQFFCFLKSYIQCCPTNYTIVETLEKSSWNDKKLPKMFLDIQSYLILLIFFCLTNFLYDVKESHVQYKRVLFITHFFIFYSLFINLVSRVYPSVINETLPLKRNSNIM